MGNRRVSHVFSLAETLVANLPRVLGHYNQLTSSAVMDTERVAKFVTIHAKILCKLAEEHPAALRAVLPTLLPFAAELIVSGKDTYAHIPERLIVQSMIILKTFAMKATEEVDQDEDETQEQIEIVKLSKQFFTRDALATLIRNVIMKYLILSSDDIELWETAPEGKFISQSEYADMYTLKYV